MHAISPVDPATFDPAGIAPIRHDFHTHPLLQFDALADLARRLMPREQCRFIAPGMKRDSAFNHQSTPTDGKGLEDVLANMAQPGSWIALYDAQVDPTYRGVLGEVEQHIRRIVAPQEKVREVRSFLFLSAPPSVTPFHIDRENNFWLQIRGRKTITLWDRHDPQVVPTDSVERHILYGTQDGVALRDDTLARGRRFDCGPGDGVYFPSTTPHMTEADPAHNGGDTLSISVGMVFYTDVMTRNARVMRCNRLLRRLGMRPRRPGLSPLRDRVKAIGGLSVLAMQRLGLLRKI